MSNALSSENSPTDGGPPGTGPEDGSIRSRDQHSTTGQHVGSVVAGKTLLFDVGVLLAWIAMTDYLIYRVGTYFAWSLSLFATLFFFGLAKRSRGHWRASMLMVALLVLLALKLSWSGSVLQIACGVFVTFCLAMAMSGLPPFLPELFAFVGMVVAGAVQRVLRFRLGSVSEASGTVKPWVGGSVLIPLTLVTCFIALFVLANPDVANSLALKFRILADTLSEWLLKFSVGEVVFALLSGWLMLGLLYPSAQKLMSELVPVELSQAKSRSTYYPTARNTLLSVIVLFVVYLVFEFFTLWFRDFPEDFYYAGYAHQGAFWLTVALALSTFVLSAIFRGSMLSDPQLPLLKKLAAAWSALNVVLAIAVCNRLYIYVEFNGMTRMRVIGLLGIACVVAGLLLVVAKIWRDRDFVWLIHRQLWMPVLAVIAFAILPVDWIVHESNVRRVLQGEPASSVQIISHLHSAEGALPLVKLVDHEDPIIRDGVRAVLAVWAQELGVAPTALESDLSAYRGRYRPELGHTSPWLWVQAGFSRQGRVSDVPWHNWQLSEELLRSKLLDIETAWQPYAKDSTLRDRTVDAFYEYAYQWY